MLRINMYFRRKTTPSGAVLQLVESFRNEQDSPRQRILASLGDAAIPEADWPLIARHVAAAIANSGQNELIDNNLSSKQAEQVDRVVRQVKRQGARSFAAVVGSPTAPSPAPPPPPATTASCSPTIPTDELNLGVGLGVGAASVPAPAGSAPDASATEAEAEDALADEGSAWLETIQHSHATSAGPELVGLYAWNALHLSQALVKNGFNDAQIRCAQASVLNRLVEPVSEHALGPWLENVSSLPDLLGDGFHGAHIEGRFLRVSDLLHKNAAHLETHLREQQEQHFGARPAIFLYDLTNTYFEGQAAANPEAKHGHSKEKRNDCPLISIALAYSQSGLPLGHKVFAGNQNDAASFPDALALLETDWKDLCAKDQRPLFVFDCGIATAPNLLLLRQKGHDYLVSERRSLRADFESVFAQQDGFTDLPGKGVRIKMETTSMPADDADANDAAAAAPIPPPRVTPGETPLGSTDTATAQTEAIAPDNLNKVPPPPVPPPRPQPWAETRLFCVSEARGEKEKAMLAKACERLEADLQKLAQRVHNGKLSAPEKVAKSIGRLCERHSSVMRYYEITPTTRNSIPAPLPPPAPPAPASAPTTAAPLDRPSAAPKKRRKAKVVKQKPLPPNGISELRWTRKPDQTPEALCGAYCLRSNRNFANAAEMWALYTSLTNAEDGFRCLKSDLGLRPVRHQVKERVHAHIFISVLALHLLCFIKKRLADAGETARTWTTLKTILRSHAYVTLSAQRPGATHHLRKIGNPNAEQRRIYDRLGIHLADCPVSRLRVPLPKNPPPSPSP